MRTGNSNSLLCPPATIASKFRSSGLLRQPRKSIWLPAHSRHSNCNWKWKVSPRSQALLHRKALPQPQKSLQNPRLPVRPRTTLLSDLRIPPLLATRDRPAADPAVPEAPKAVALQALATVRVAAMAAPAKVAGAEHFSK